MIQAGQQRAGRRQQFGAPLTVRDEIVPAHSTHM
jgi:hypothetical protein